MQCQAFKTSCPNHECNFKYHGHDKGKMICPLCGTERIRCNNRPVLPYKYCKYHGGPNPKNNYYGAGGYLVTGENSQFQLTRLASKYNEMKKDARLLSNRASLEVVKARIQQLLERIDLNEAPDRLGNIKKLWDNVKESDGPTRTMASILLDEEFEKAYHDYAAWKQMFEAIDIDRKLVESEVKIIKDMRAVLTAEDGYELTAQLMSAVMAATGAMEDIPDHVKMHFLKRIQYEFTRVVGERIGGGAGDSLSADSDAESGIVDRE